jgi:hypothetical protein
VKIALAALVVALCLTGVDGRANALEASDPQASYDGGDFLAAAASGEARGDAAGLSLASKALLALSMTDWRDTQAGIRLDRAERNANAALALAPTALEPRLNLAVALGMKSRRVALGEALRQKYASRGRALIDQALTMAPNDAAAQALLGSWNLEVVRRGGVVGSRLLGASSRAGMSAFDKAMSVSPGDPAIALQYAVALLGVDAKRYGEKAGSLLTAASTMAPRDAFEAAMRDEARRLSAVMAAGGAQAAAKQAAKAFL